MKIGASTSNLYPLHTEGALDVLLDLGFRTLEVFVNTESETAPAFARELHRRAERAGGEILSLHSYTAGTDPYLLFSAYRRRFEDGREHYRRLFEAAALAGARYVVVHGDREGGVLPEEEVFARYEELYDLGRAQGVTLLQENVVRFRSGDPGFLRRMRERLGGKARFVFDSKQCARCGLEPAAVLDAMGEGLCHVHISDQGKNRDCLIPGQGENDFAVLLAQMRSHGFQGSWILELYRENFGAPSDLVRGRRFLEQLLEP
ncbi:MAG TPA: sugar phosphate isomerase/epimerase [Firmicutes bacterium]|nr:sugar phosphate isomerase/epimerase [Bacillota bacterium]